MVCLHIDMVISFIIHKRGKLNYLNYEITIILPSKDRMTSRIDDFTDKIYPRENLSHDEDSDQVGLKLICSAKDLEMF